jgi:hypothetical protein
MNRKKLKETVDFIQGLHYVSIADVKPGREGNVIGDGHPPAPTELDALYLDKCLATADAFGLKTEPDDWRPTGGTTFEYVSDKHRFVFDAELGLSMADHGMQPIEIHAAEDLRRKPVAVAEVSE